MAGEYLAKELPDITPVPSRATYLLWLDCSRAAGDATQLSHYLRSETGLCLSAGITYGGNGSRFLRMNIACPRSRVEDGLLRLKSGLKAYEAYAAKSC